MVDLLSIAIAFPVSCSATPKSETNSRFGKDFLSFQSVIISVKFLKGLVYISCDRNAPKKRFRRGYEATEIEMRMGYKSSGDGP